MSGYIWYSAGSDVTGPKLAEALGFAHGKKTPQLSKVKVLVGWGCKAESREMYDPKKLKEALEKREVRLLNHPGAITAARNKLGLLISLQEANVAIPGHFSIKGMSPAAAVTALHQAVDNGVLALPCIGLNEFHKGKPVFCWTKEDLEKAANLNKSRKKDAVKLHYFRSLLQGTEYRIHVFRDEVLAGEVKKLSDDPTAAAAKSLLGRIKKRTKGDVSATEDDIKLVVDELAADLLNGPSHMQKSIQYGWEMQEIPVGQIPAPAAAAAIDALDAAGLDMGAVSVILEEDQGLVTNIVSAPGLSDAQMALYVEAIKEFTGKDGAAEEKKGAKAKKKAPAGEESRASQEIIAKITRRVRTGKISQEKAEEVLKALE